MSTIVIESLSLGPSEIFDLNGGDVYLIENHTEGEWNGDATANSVIQCTNGIGYIDLSLIGNINAQYITFVNISVLNGFIYADAGSVDGGNNSGIIFANNNASGGSNTNLSIGVGI